ncbi:MAG: hypothetical protein J6U60_03225 [Clostridia bacterium]|nr:hypothetical protein [Clostridia bacterium]
MTFAKKRFRIICTVIAMVLVTIMMSVGIYAASQGVVNGSGTVTFAAKDVFVTVTTTKQKNTEQEVSLDTIKFDAVTNPGENTSTKNLSLGDFAFTKATDVWVLKLSITNDFSEEAKAGVALNHVAESITVTNTAYKDYVIFTTAVSDNISDDRILQAGETGTITIEIKLNTASEGVQTGLEAIGFTFTLTLDRQTIAA